MRAGAGGRGRTLAALAALFALLALLPRADAGQAAPVVAGWVERVRISPGDLVIEAKLDSGARTSRLRARGRPPAASARITSV
jgi:hypothetical protein